MIPFGLYDALFAKKISPQAWLNWEAQYLPNGKTALDRQVSRLKPYTY